MARLKLGLFFPIRNVPRRSLAALCCSLLAILSLGADKAPAPEPPKPERDEPANQAAARVGRLIRVEVPIVDNVDSRTKDITRQVIYRLDSTNSRPILVFEFSTGQTEFGRGSEFGRSLSLAKFLSSPELGGFKTVAYIPKSIKGHAVLPVMACEEIFMAPDAQLGEAGVDEQMIGDLLRGAYKEIASRRKTIPSAIALGMLDKNLKVLQVKPLEGGVRYLLPDGLEELKKTHTIERQKVLIDEQESGLFRGSVLKNELNVVTYLAADRQDVARRLGLPISAIEDDPSLKGWKNAVGIRLHGKIDVKMVKQVQRDINLHVFNANGTYKQQGSNFVCLEIDSAGGSFEHSITLANYLNKLDPTKVRTVAYIPNEAQAEAALVALACDHIVMHSEATLGGKSSDEKHFTDVQINDTLETLKKSAKKKYRNWSLYAAIFDSNLKVARYRHSAKGTVAYFCEDELNELKDKDQWVRSPELVERPLEVQGDRAKELRLAREVVQDEKGMLQYYGVEEIKWVEPSWVDKLLGALARPEVAMFLLLIGGVAVYAELQMPGIGLGGFVATVCFVLFFWAKYMEQTATELEIILFLLGVIFLVLEVFVIPGFGIFGLGGGLLIIVSVVLAGIDYSASDFEVEEFQKSLLSVCGAGVGIVITGFLMRRYLPRAPVLSRIMLEPPSQEEQSHILKRESLTDFEHLVGSQGVTTTQLTPSGKALFGNDLINVVSEGGLIPRDAKVIVAEVHGNRVVVLAADQD